jgi:hypothetical protein
VRVKKQKPDPTLVKAVEESADAMREGLRIDKDLLLEKPNLEKQIKTAVAQLWKYGKIKGPDDIRAFFVAYYDPSPDNWRGRAGKPPASAGRVLELWGEYMGPQYGAKPPSPSAHKLTPAERKAYEAMYAADQQNQ